MKWILLTLGLLVGAFLEALVIKIPFVWILLLISLIFVHKQWILILSIPSGILLDSFTFRMVGESSLFFALMMAFFFAYGKKFELQSIGFVLAGSAISTFCYFLVFGSDQLVFQTILSVGVAVVLFGICTFLKEKFAPPGRFYYSM